MFSRRTMIRYFFWSLGVIAFINALFNIHLTHATTFCSLILLLMVVELFPVRVGVVRYTASFPILFSMGLVTGFPLTAVISVILLALQYPLAKRYRKVDGTIGWMSARATALLVTGWFMQFPNWIGIPKTHFFPYAMSLLVATTVVFSLICNFVVYWTAPASRNLTAGVRHVFVLVGTDISLTFVYDGFMFWLASNPKNVQTGSIGTVFFYLPLVLAALVLHLISNLTRAKTQLETLLELSKSISEHGELEDMIDRITLAAKQLVNSSMAILLLSSGDGTFQVVSESGKSERIYTAGEIIDHVVRTKSARRVRNVIEEGDFPLYAKLPGIKALIAVPVLSSGNVKGVLIAGHYRADYFQEEDEEILESFANHASIVLDNMDYLEERERRLLVEERNRLARDIHDGVAQELATASLQLEWLRRHPEDFENRVNQVHSLLTRGIREIRQSIYSLRPQPYAHIGLIPAIEKYARELERTSGLKISFETSGSIKKIGAEYAEIIYQVVQETCQNTVKHARASELSIHLNVTGDTCSLIIADDGVGFNLGQTILRAAERQSFGIENLHLLVDRIGASIEYETAPQAGTRVEVSIPIKESPSREERIHLTLR